MATPSDLLNAIGCLGQTFPQFVQHEIARLTDEFVASIKSLPNPLAQVGDLSVQSLVSDVAALSQGDTLGAVADVAGIVDQLANGHVSSLVPGALSGATGNRTQDVLNLGASVAGQAMLTLALVPETPFVIAQRLVETLTQILATKLATLVCLGKHIIQLSNVTTVLVEMRKLAVPGLAVDLAEVEGDLLTAIRELTASRRSLGGVLSFDVSAFDRGRAALERALAALVPKLPSDSVLSFASVLNASGTLPASALTPANARLALSVVAPLASLIRQEVAALQAQSNAIRFYVQQLRAVVTNYRASPAAQSVVALRLQTVAALIGKVQDVEANVHTARVRDPAQASVPQLLDWSVAIRSVLALASKIRADELVEGALDAGVEVALKTTYAALIAAIDAINSAHVSKGDEDITDLAGSCLGLCTQAELLLARYGDVRAADSDLRTFQVLVANTAVKMGNRLGESERAASALEAACAPMLLLAIAARATIDKLIAGLGTLGLDRGRDLLASGQFAELLGSSADDLSYVGSAIACLTDVLAGIEDAGLRRQVAAIREDLIGRKTNSLLSAADNVDFAGLRRTEGIKDEIASLQQSAQTVAAILDYLKGIAASLSLDLSTIDPLGHAELLGDVDYLSVGAGGALAPGAGVPAC